MPTNYSPLERLFAQVVQWILYLLIGASHSGRMHDSAWKDAATHLMSLYGLVPWARIGPD
jgi:hypothetical protein